MKVTITIKQGKSELTEVNDLYRYCSQNRMPYTEIFNHLQKNNTYTKRVNDCKIVIERKDK